MSARIRIATLGAAAAAGVAVALLAASPWRPSGPWVAAVVVLLVLPLTTAVGAATLLRLRGHVDPGATARLAAVGAPAMAIFLQFALLAVLSTRAPGPQQVLAFVLGAATSAALAARFTGPDAEAASDADPPPRGQGG